MPNSMRVKRKQEKKALAYVGKAAIKHVHEVEEHLTAHVIAAGLYTSC